MHRDSYAHLYGKRWHATAKRHLARNPLCVTCLAAGRLAAATVVDHIRPHRGDRALFWDPRNRQSLCKHCHNSTKQKLEAAARKAQQLEAERCDVTGHPTDFEW